MRDVAALAGVGIKTVSRVVNDEPGVSEGTRQRVLEAAKLLNYQLDLTAQSLRRAGRQTRSVGLLLPSVANPFHGQIHRALSDVLASHDIAVLSASLDDNATREEELVKAFLRRRVDGLVLTPVANSQGYLPEHSKDLPMVFIDREPVGIGADAVVSDNAAGAAKATVHLISQGHTKLAYLGGRTDIQTARERRRGFINELDRAGISTDTVQFLEGLRTEESARTAARELFTGAEPPTAIFSAQILVTFGVMRALQELGLNRTVALVGFGDFTLSDMMNPGITVVAQYPEHIGRSAAERILARISGDSQEPRTYTIPCELILRGSGEVPPPSRPNVRKALASDRPGSHRRNGANAEGDRTSVSSQQRGCP
ncbi:LacI family transcriptional regulator [Arthrobacter sp. FW305-BF8]|uniref:LacI family DNA-binding transcriptional regulator n=1 Tax=Arthrobacter sp. FW305-BF8 TaxID=2879617 RepID=UPI001F1C6079|nr:LacI family DNA-binding transcriptional regulator [Arthrobacter sp. FW305-BF8]UKA56610.1 LacI family transcriptional regulator [Arthrobacter sp. FW305-BF8]